MPEIAETLPEPDPAAYQRALAVLLDVGTAIMIELKTPSSDINAADRAAAFDRVALAIRRTIILSRDIAANTVVPETRRVLARKQVVRAVDDKIHEKATPADAKQLRIELLERIDSPEFEFDLAHRPWGDLIKDLCRDFGLANTPVTTYPRRTPDDIVVLCAQAAAPAGSGLPQWLAAADIQAQKNDAAAAATRKPPS